MLDSCSFVHDVTLLVAHFLVFSDVIFHKIFWSFGRRSSFLKSVGSSAVNKEPEIRVAWSHIIVQQSFTLKLIHDN